MWRRRLERVAIRNRVHIITCENWREKVVREADRRSGILRSRTQKSCLVKNG